MSDTADNPRTGDRARLYQSLRTAHLERAHELPAARIIYAETRYDFDPALTAGLTLIDGRGFRAAIELFRRPPDILEVNEPLMVQSAAWTAVALLALRVGGVMARRPRTRVVAYAIENRDPRLNLQARLPLKARLKLSVGQVAARLVAAQLDRIAFGTAAARDLYAQGWLSARTESALIWALPRPVPRDPGGTPTAVFASAFSRRKGIDTLLACWPSVRERVPRARLVLVGTGAQAAEVKEAALADSAIEVVESPPRSEVLRILASCRVVVLPSRPMVNWREQVGLPIVEGLSFGRTIVTTTETGLATWLLNHGHRVIPPDDPSALAEALAGALIQPLEVCEVLGSLPALDGRLAADAWLFEGRP